MTPINEDFTTELERLINRHSIDSRSDTPDYLLAMYMRDCLAVYERTVAARDRWNETALELVYGKSAEPKTD